jgi:CheY-like chemotaxis protein
VRGNGEELTEAILALGHNAVEASSEGDVVTLSLDDDGSAATLTVADRGAGMSRDIRRRAFDPFFTTKGARKKGLGLSLAYGIVRRHEGEIELESAIGKGTRVYLRLPALTAASTEPPGLVSAPPVSTEAAVRHVLLVEDDLDNRDALATLLELSGYRVTAADCGSAGLTAFRETAFDLVLTDLGLPDIDGWQVAGQIKAVAPTTPVALITGWGFNLDGAEIERRGVDLLVKKPIDPSSFLSQVAQLVGRRAA